MKTIHVLAIGLDWNLLESHNAAWKSAGFSATSIASVKAAIDHLQAGEFDLVLLGGSIPIEARERLTFLIRSAGSHVPVACITGSPDHHDTFADATFHQDSADLLNGMRELLMSKSKSRTIPESLDATST